MPITVVLGVGLDSWQQINMGPAWNALGFTVKSVDSIQDAIHQLRYGDFDLVMLGDNLSAEKKERLVFLLRSSGSKVPVVSAEGCSSHHGSVLDSDLKNHEFLASLKDLVSEDSGRKTIRH